MFDLTDIVKKLSGLDIATFMNKTSKKEGEIYRIWFDNDPQERSYVGQTVQGALNRIKQHIADAQNNDGTGCPILDAATREFGINHMCYELLQDNIETYEELDMAEKFYIRQYNSQYPGGFNVKSGGQKKGGSFTPIDDEKNHTFSQRNPLLASLVQSAVSRSNLGDEAKNALMTLLK